MHVTETAEKIKRMEIRGAGRIARAAVEALVEEAGTLPAPRISILFIFSAVSVTCMGTLPRGCAWEG